MNESAAFDSPEWVTVVDPDGIECVLAAADASEMDDISVWLRTLPRTAYGMVFVEVPAGVAISPLEAPVGVGVTWLAADSADVGVSADERRGEALARAVEAWLDEWLWADSGCVRNFQLWTGTHTSPIMETYWSGVDRRLAKRWPGCAQLDCPVRDLGRSRAE